MGTLLSELGSEDLWPVDDLPPARHVAKVLRRGKCPDDRLFDRFLPHEERVVSDMHWTPLAVAVRAAAWFDKLDIRTVVDIGSGAGKFCVAAALAGQARFMGLEQRARLVATARELASVFDVEDRVAFVQGKLGETPVPAADAYYLFNPFGENTLGEEDHLDEDVELSESRYRRDIAAAEDLLRAAPGGTYLVTYNGFGGEPPEAYREISVARETLNALRIWRKNA